MNKHLFAWRSRRLRSDRHPASAAPTSVSNGPATAHAKIVKPLTLTRCQDLDFGTIVVRDAGTGGEVDTRPGAFTCGGGATLTCSGPATAATYHVTGTNNQVVHGQHAERHADNAGNRARP